MGRHRIIILASSLGLVACLPTSSDRGLTSSFGGAAPTETTGAAGEQGGGAGAAFFAPDGGREGVDGGSTCVGGVATAPPHPPGLEGPQPVIPSTPTTAATPVPPLSGGTLAVLADGKTAVASDPDRDQVYVVDLGGGTVRAAVLQPGDEPGRVVEDAAGRAHVVLRRGGAIASIDPATAAIVARRPVCSAPRGIAYQATGGPANDVLEVACAGGELVTLPAGGGAALRTVMLERDLRDVVAGPNGTLLVSTFRKAQALVVGADGKQISALVPGAGPVPSVIGPPQNMTPSVAWRMVPYDTTVGSVVMLHQTGVTDMIDPAAGGYAGVKGCGGIVQPGISVLAPGASPPPVAGGLGDLSVVVDVAVSPDKTRIAVAAAGNNQIPGQPTLVESDVAHMTEDAAMSPCTGGVGAVPNAPVGQVVAVAYSQSGELFAQTREPASLWRADGTTITLASDSRADTGHLIFHSNAGGGLACASCHPEGGEDGRIWTFVCAGERRTQSIRGGISQTAPFHWDGSEHDFSHLMDDVFSGRMAGPILSPDQKTALQSWVDTIPAMPQTANLDAAAVVRGAMLFDDAKVGCVTCHAGTLLTNNTTVDVGTGQAFQVPSLRGVSWRSPLMHNGCALTLDDRFTDPGCGGGDKHGLTSTLTPAQISDLTTYLESL
ncbi:MAG TPA: cytochrome-c peroxidase [Polyangia bacterium]|nr:cytochrome-c peroxidase [Polyangia bacterium]